MIAWSTEGQSIERFEVASVRISPPAATGKASWSDPGETTFTAKSIPLQILIQMAYEVDEKQISGEALCGSEQYDVVAKPEAGILTSERLQPMLISLLAERFGLVTHRETKAVSGYVLVTAKGGSKLQVSDASRAGRSAILRGRIIGRGTDMGLLASMLGRPLRAPVVDKTGIEGTYDIDLKFAPEDSADSSLPSLFTAMQEQLGLKLESRKVPLQMLVIDRCRRAPAEN
ncbi:MAG: TIGR03435 family protein [Acidobacteriota bacterium]